MLHVLLYSNHTTELQTITEMSHHTFVTLWCNELFCTYLDDVEARTVLSPTTNANANKVISIFFQTHSTRYCWNPPVHNQAWYVKICNVVKPVLGSFL